MADITISVGEYISFDDVKRIIESAKKLDAEDELIVSLNSVDAYKADSIFTVLEKNNFDLSTKGGHDGKNYYIIARKK